MAMPYWLAFWNGIPERGDYCPMSVKLMDGSLGRTTR